MTNEEKRLRIEALESELLSDVTAENFAEKTEALLACDRLYFSYANRYISYDRSGESCERTPGLIFPPATEPEPESTPETEQKTAPDPDLAPWDTAEPEQDTAPTKDYMVKVLSNAANTKGVDVGACIASLGYKKLSDMPRDKYRELLKLAGCDE